MKVLQVNAVYGIGSTGVIVEDIHNLCIEKGIESYVAYSYSDLSENTIKNAYIIGKNTRFGKKLHGILARISGKQAYFSSYSTKKFIKYIKKIKPDIIHLHNLHSNYINLNLLLKFLAKENIKTIITQHDCWYYTGKCFHYTSKGCFKWQTGCNNCQFRKNDTPAYIFDGSKKVWNDKNKYLNAIKNLTVTSVSTWLTNEAKKSFLKGKKSITVHNGVDMNIFKPNESNFRKDYGLENKFVILGMANKWLSEINKGALESIIEALDQDYAIVLLGCSEAQKQRIANKNVIALGYIRDRYELAKVYSMADVFVNLTREDALSLVNIEALACGTPLITYAVTGTTDTVDDNVGFGVSVGNVNGIISSIKTVKEYGKSKYTLSCINKVSAEFEKNNCYQDYIDLYQEVYLNEG